MRITDGMMQSGGLEALKKVAGTRKEVEKTSRKDRAEDSVQLSGKSRKMSAEAEKASVTQRVNASPEIRQDRISEVQAKIKSGYYDSPEFQDKLADRLMNHFGFGE